MRTNRYITDICSCKDTVLSTVPIVQYKCTSTVRQTHFDEEDDIMIFDDKTSGLLGQRETD